MNSKTVNGMKCFLYVFGLLGMALSAQGASFDCGKAGTKVEKLICGDAELSKLDEELSAAYKTVLNDQKQADTVKQTQKLWMKERNGCADADCVKRAYETRLSSLTVTTVQIKVQGFPLNPKDPKAIRRGSPKPYVLVMSKDIGLCSHMLRLFNDDLERYGWDGDGYHDQHEEFKRIPWKKARASYEADGRVHYTDVEGALFDFNNDGVQDFVVRDKSMLSGMTVDRLIMLDADAAKRANDMTYKELGDSKNSIDMAWSSHILSSPLEGQDEALWRLSPFSYRDTSYLFMRPIAVGYMSNFAVIVKYIGGRFEYRDVTGKMEDICYYQQNGAKHGK